MDPDPLQVDAPPSAYESVVPAESRMADRDIELARALVRAHRKLTEEVSKRIVGQSEVIDQLLIAVLARGHCLLEGVPGLAKTLMVRSLAEAIELSFRRIQFTPDLMPADITGTDIIQEDAATNTRQLVFEKGPIFSQMLLADEINRTPPKTQAALLEAMQEHSVTVGGRTYRLEEPFFVLATQNPIEQEGTYPLPEAQRDRFLLHVKVKYPNRQQEKQIIEQTTGAIEGEIRPVLTGKHIVACQQIVRKVPVPDHVLEFVLDLVRKSRPEESEALTIVREFVQWGPGPRAAQCLVMGAKVRALLKGRYHVTVDDVRELAHPVLRHRIVPTFNAESRGMNADDIISQILDAVVGNRDVQLI